MAWILTGPSTGDLSVRGSTYRRSPGLSMSVHVNSAENCLPERSLASCLSTCPSCCRSPSRQHAPRSDDDPRWNYRVLIKSKPLAKPICTYHQPTCLRICNRLPESRFRPICLLHRCDDQEHSETTAVGRRTWRNSRPVFLASGGQ